MLVIKRRTFSAGLLALLLTNVLVLVFGVQPFGASETVHVQDDGVVDSLTRVVEKHGASILSEPPPTTQWNKTFGGFLEDMSFSVVQTGDGGYAIGGWTDSGSSGFDGWLVNTDADGNVRWTQTYGGGEDDHDTSLIRTSDGGYALAGFCSSYDVVPPLDFDFWLVKADASGNIQWNLTYGGENGDWAYSVVQAGDGGFAMAGETEANSPGDLQTYLVRCDAVGNVRWRRNLASPGFDGARCLVQDGSGGFTVCGYTTYYGSGGGYDATLFNVDDLSGSVQWSVAYGGAGFDLAYSVINTSDGGYALAGETGSYGAGARDVWLIKTDSTGSMQWSRTYGGTLDDGAYSIFETDDGGYALAGYTFSYGAGGADFWLIKTDQDGNTQWSNTYGGVMDDDAYSVAQTDDKGYALTGWTTSYGNGSSDAWLIKLEGIRNIAVTNLVPSRTTVGKGSSLYVNATVENEGSTTETFNVTLYVRGEATLNETGLVGYWKFDEGNGSTINDWSDYDNDGTIYDATWVNGKFGTALDFDGSNDHVRIPDSNSLDIVGDLTIAAWIKTFQASGLGKIFSNHRLVSPSDGCALEIADERVRFFSQGTDMFSISTVSTGTWKHVAVTLSDTTATIYVDGAFDASGTVGIPNTNDLDQTIGASYWPNYFFQGLIDEVRVYNRALSAEEIRAVANSGNVTIETKTLILSRVSSANVTFTWNTTGFAFGNYSLSVYASPVEGETLTEDNTLFGGWVYIGIPGDINGDSIVNIFDAVLLASAAGSDPTKPNWNPNADINNDLVVNIFDAVMLAAHAGQSES